MSKDKYADMTMYQAINAGKYNPTVEYPSPNLKKTNPKLYRQQLDVYHKDLGYKQDQFKSDLEEEFGIQNSPLKDQIYSRAYSEGHSSGYSEVYLIYDDLVELFAKVAEIAIKKAYDSGFLDGKDSIKSI